VTGRLLQGDQVKSIALLFLNYSGGFDHAEREGQISTSIILEGEDLKSETLTTLLLHKPYGVLSQFTAEAGARWGTLAEIIPVPGVYAVGRLDADSEGLLILTSIGRLQARLSQPHWGHWRTYHVQVEGTVSEDQLKLLRSGVCIQQQFTLEAKARTLDGDLWAPRSPPIRFRRKIPTSWIEISLREGRNRQVRRMTAAVGLPTLRLIRVAIDLMDGGPPFTLAGMAPGEWRPLNREEERRLQALLTQPSTSINCRAVCSWPK
jgi:23S rRNA pseudouridine2457 synthase